MSEDGQGLSVLLSTVVINGALVNDSIATDETSDGIRVVVTSRGGAVVAATLVVLSDVDDVSSACCVVANRGCWDVEPTCS